MLRRIKSLGRFCLTGIKRFFSNIHARLYFLVRGSILHKPLQVRRIRGVKLGVRVSVDSYARLECFKNKDCPKPVIVLGDHVNLMFHVTLLCASRLTIGAHTTLASHVLVTTENHGIDPEGDDYMLQELVSRDVTIGEYCWLGERVCVLPGVTIGDRSIIGAGSVVTHDIPAYSIAVGNPARVIKTYHFDTHRWESVENQTLETEEK